MNLGTNAFHAMREKGGVLTVRLEELAQVAHPEGLESKDGWLRLSIRDTGCGMSNDNMDRLFEPFFTTKAIGEGTGLGLPVVHGIVTAARGFIEVDSTVGRGSCFKVYLPLIDAVAVPVPMEGAGGAQLPGSSYRVLCVDDEKILTNMIQRSLESLGYQVTVANDGAAALSLLQQRPQDYDILLTDQTMPRMTGLELIRAVRKLCPQLPIILLTGYDSEMVSMAQCQELGILLRRKPLTEAELGNVLQVVLRRQRKSKKFNPPHAHKGILQAGAAVP